MTLVFLTCSTRIAGNAPLATYLFADPASCKYMSQFTTAHLSFANHFPLDLLGRQPIHVPLHLPRPD